MQARSRSDKFAAVLRLQRTQPKDRRIYTAFTGILARRRLLQREWGAGRARSQGRRLRGNMLRNWEGYE
ncbi:hypothetical protein BEI59_00115 [Eisenbergiella tayi]|uniref:Uncharacterized protein n=1 Tax=Eisenbergiella tayi TaxID=1432052 RepID=A0A1E3UNN3_9FIRM|nr:hypothetical protein BEI63_30015 [Eisenbergiella tayi]ODR55616.1 hypothetical protein BEI59_00115 [Eisenbergiella tayi]